MKEKTDEKLTRDKRGVFEFSADSTGGGGGVVKHFLDKIDIGKSTFTEWPENPESIIVDPNIGASIGGVVESIQSRERASHFLLSKLHRQISLLLNQFLCSSPNFGTDRLYVFQFYLYTYDFPPSKTRRLTILYSTK